MGNHENKLYSYKMARATGFAPNPHFGVLTLAACKSGLRRAAQPGDWIAGWTAKGLKECPTDTGDERLVYLARVTRKLTFPEYWEQYPQKRPVLKDRNADAYHGDNIYEPLPNRTHDPQQPDTFRQHKCSQDKEKIKKAKDLKGIYVLVCEEFYYFNPSSPLEIPEAIRPKVPEGRSNPGAVTENPEEFIAYVKKHFGKCEKTSVA